MARRGAGTRRGPTWRWAITSTRSTRIRPGTTSATGPAHAGQGYYSYDLGAWHVVMLNDNIAFGPGSAQDTWLQQDLAASASTCTIAVFHQPLFVSGTTGAHAVQKGHLGSALCGGRRDRAQRAPALVRAVRAATPDGTVDTVNGIREFVVGTGGNTIDIGTPTAANVEKQGNTGAC